jgi:hypothetical protein
MHLQNMCSQGKYLLSCIECAHIAEAGSTLPQTIQKSSHKQKTLLKTFHYTRLYQYNQTPVNFCTFDSANSLQRYIFIVQSFMIAMDDSANNHI